MRDAKTIVNTVKNQISKPVEVDRNKTAPQCRNCAYYHPEFKYRISVSMERNIITFLPGWDKTVKNFENLLTSLLGRVILTMCQVNFASGGKS